MNEPTIDNVPVSMLYRLCYDKLKEMKGVDFKPVLAVKSIAKSHTQKVKDIIDEDMAEYDEKQLMAIVERCVLKYVKVEADD